MAGSEAGRQAGPAVAAWKSRGGCVVAGQWAMAWVVSLLVLVLVLVSVSVERRAGAAAAVGEGWWWCVAAAAKNDARGDVQGRDERNAPGRVRDGRGGRQEVRAKAVAAARREDGSGAESQETDGQTDGEWEWKTGTGTGTGTRERRRAGNRWATLESSWSAPLGQPCPQGPKLHPPPEALADACWQPALALALALALPRSSAADAPKSTSAIAPVPLCCAVLRRAAPCCVALCCAAIIHPSIPLLAGFPSIAVALSATAGA
jgi:hypothetical protein